MFVDSSAWFAAYVPTDPQYRIVQNALASSDRLVTTDYVLDETLTLLKARGHADRARRFGTRIFDGSAARLEHITELDVQQAWIVFSTYRDKEWSFTDCTRLVVMQRLGITQAVALDQHFQQMPGIGVVDQENCKVVFFRASTDAMAFPVSRNSSRESLSGSADAIAAGCANPVENRLCSSPAWWT